MILCKVNRLLYKPNFIRPLIRFTHDDYAKVLYPLESRKLLKVSGADSSAFLQGLITNDMNHFSDGAQSMYAMFLNGKGRILYDTLIHKWIDDSVFLVECDKCVIQLLKKHLKMYKLKRQVHVGDISALFKVWALILPFNTDVEVINDIHCNINIYKDPRLSELGYRIITTNNVDQFDLQEVVGKDTVMESNENGYKYLRYRLGISEGADDLFPGTCLPQEANCDYLHGVSFHKGCYIGQELLARVHHTGVVRKRMMPLKFNNTTKAEGLEKDAEILAVDDGTTAVGKLKSYAYDYGLGLIRIKEALDAKSLSVGPYTINIAKPSWWPVEASREKINVIKPQREQNENI